MSVTLTFNEYVMIELQEEDNIKDDYDDYGYDSYDSDIEYTTDN